MSVISGPIGASAIFKWASVTSDPKYVQICACECPGAGKWVQGDEESRARFRERTARRHEELSALVQGSWDTMLEYPSTSAHHRPGTETAFPGAHHGTRVTMRRLPADINDQIIAARAAESFFSALDSTAAHGSGGGGGGDGGGLGSLGVVGLSSEAATISAHYNEHGCGGGRICCGEAITTVKRRKLDTPPKPIGYNRGRQHNNSSHSGGYPQHEGFGDHCDHHHKHRCDHPHDECTSDCCSAISKA